MKRNEEGIKRRRRKKKRRRAKIRGSTKGVGKGEIRNRVRRRQGSITVVKEEGKRKERWEDNQE